MNDQEYYKGWPMYGPYVDDLKWASNIAINYLQKIAPKYKKYTPKNTSGLYGVAIFDLDDTLFQGDDAELLLETPMIQIAEKHKNSQGHEQEIFLYPLNMTIVQIAKEAYRLGFRVVALTARPYKYHLASQMNLKMMGVPHHDLIMNSKDEDPAFKVKVRKGIEKNWGAKIVFTIGDQWTDLFLPGEALAVKLPEREHKCAYAYIPEKWT